jgi:hypothetical protein
LNLDEAHAYNEFYTINYPNAEYYVITYSGKIVKRNFPDYLAAYEAGLEYQLDHPDEIVDVWVKVRETVNSTLTAMEAC